MYATVLARWNSTVCTTDSLFIVSDGSRLGGWVIRAMHVNWSMSQNRYVCFAQEATTDRWVWIGASGLYFCAALLYPYVVLVSIMPCSRDGCLPTFDGVRLVLIAQQISRCTQSVKGRLYFAPSHFRAFSANRLAHRVARVSRGMNRRWR